MKRIISTLIAGLAALALGCAKTGPPPGGPVDEIAPEIVSADPLPGTTNVPVDVSVQVTFSESMKAAGLGKAFSLSPPPPGAVHARWSGRTVRFRFDPPLLANRTYVLSLGTGLSDLHGNPLKDTYHLAFSTGDRLDQGWINGLLDVQGAAAGWSIIGYYLTADSIQGDPDPAYDVPDAATQANADGSWELLHLKEGQWRIFAFKDADSDRLWTPWSEKLAVPAYDVEAKEDTTYQSRFLTLHPVDRPALPEPLRLNAFVRDVIEVRFDRKPYSLDSQFELMTVPDSVAKSMEVEVDPDDAEIPVESIGYKAGDSTTVQVHLAQRPAGDALWLHILGAFGTGSVLDTTMGVSLLKSSEIDTFLPGIVSIDPPVNSRLHKGARAIEFTFTKPMAVFDEGAIRLVYASTQDTVLPLIGNTDPWRKVILVNPAVGGELDVELFGAKIVDLNGYALEDSLRIVKYTLLPGDSLGTLSGKVQYPTQDAAIHLSLKDLADKELELSESLKQAGDFRFASVPEGLWKIRGWVDRDGDGIWSMGQAVPFKPSDPTYASSDTLIIRARWESAGTIFIFP